MFLCPHGARITRNQATAALEGIYNHARTIPDNQLKFKAIMKILFGNQIWGPTQCR